MPRMHDPDIVPLITRLAKKHEVDYENLDDNIKAFICELAVDALDCRRMDGALRHAETPHPRR